MLADASRSFVSPLAIPQIEPYPEELSRPNGRLLLAACSLDQPAAADPGMRSQAWLARPEPHGPCLSTRIPFARRRRLLLSRKVRGVKVHVDHRPGGGRAPGEGRSSAHSHPLRFPAVGRARVCRAHGSLDEDVRRDWFVRARRGGAAPRATPADGREGRGALGRPTAARVGGRGDRAA